MNLSGKVALVTGAANRVGRAVALRLAQAGCRVAVHYNRSSPDAEQTASECLAAGAPQAAVFHADLAEPEAPRILVQAVVQKFDALDLLINNAAIFQRMAFDDFNLADWDRCLRINLTAPMAITFAARAHLRAARGRVINICDSATARPWPTHLAYVASKNALASMTQALARALAPDVNVVGIAPGTVAWADEYDEPTRRRLTEKIPLQKAGDPADIAAAVNYLLADGDYVTGAIINVDGGRSIV